MKLYNHFLENAVLPLGDTLLGTQYISTLKELRSIQHLSESGLEELQQKKLSNVLTHAVNHIPFYKILRKGNEAPSISDFPIMTKVVIKENLDNLLWHPEIKGELICEKSSGSSGVQGQVFMSRKEQSIVQAAQTLFWEWAGYRIGTSILQTGMTLNRGTVKKTKDILFRTDRKSVV